jgi:hypothetical protein
MTRNLIVSIDELKTSRYSELKELVRDVSPDFRKIQITQLNQSGKLCFVISDRMIQSQDIKEYDFQTKSKKIRASYFEVWDKLSKDTYYLSKAYMHLHRTDDEYLAVRTDGEYILLHCDPNDNDEHGDYKRSPHLHFENAGFPINKAHIALNLSNINQLLTSRRDLNIALRSAIVMLNKQILERY